MSNLSSPEKNITSKIKKSEVQLAFESLILCDYNLKKLFDLLQFDKVFSSKVEEILSEQEGGVTIEEIYKKYIVKSADVPNMFNNIFTTFCDKYSDMLDFNSIDLDSKSLLMHTITNKNIFYSIYLINKGADINKQGALNWTPLHQACVLSDVEDIVKLILSKGTNIQALNTNQQNALHMACGKNRLFNVKILLSYLQNDKNINIDFIRDYINAKDHINMTPLNKACASGAFDSARELIEFEISSQRLVDINTQDIEGNTPLHYIMERGNDDLAIYLINLGAKPLLNKSGKYCYELLDNNKAKEKLLECIIKLKNQA